MFINFDIGSAQRIVKIEIDTIGDGEPGWEMNLGPTTDGRAIRGFSVKPVINGVWNFYVKATDVNGCTGQSSGQQTVTVVF